MRFLAAVLSCLFFSAPAMAETASEVEIEAARAIAETMTDSRVMDAAIDVQLPTAVAGLRENILGSAFYADLRPDSQQALNAYVDTLAEFIRDIIAAQIALMRDDFARRLVERYSEPELVSYAAVVSEPILRELIIQGAEAMMRGHAYDRDAMTEAQRAALSRLEASPDLEQHMPHPWDVTRLAADSSVAAQAAMRTVMEQRFLTDLCNVLADECPAHVRAHVSTFSN